MFQHTSRIVRFLGLILLAVGISLPAEAQSRVKVTDIRGRAVEVSVPAKRMLIDDGRFLVALSLLHSDPSKGLAAWPRDTARIGEQLWADLKGKFPSLSRLATIPSSAAPFSLERVIAIKPDIAVFSLGHGPSDSELQLLDRAGIKVVFIDFFKSPMKNLEPSLEVLGRLTGSDARAKEFLTFRREHLAKISSALAKDSRLIRPRVLLETHAGISPECCFAPGRGNIGDYLEFAGGQNIGAEVIPGATGKLHIEYIIAQNPAVYIATGGPHLEKAGGVVVGPGFSDERTRAALKKMTSRSGFERLRAVKDGRVHALSHQLLNSPLDLLALEALARWLHPELFADVDPSATLAELNSRFLAVPLKGSWWLDK